MVLTIETAILNSLLGIFGGNPLILAVFAVLFFLGVFLLLRIPLILMTPFIVIVFLMVGQLMEGFTVVIGLAVGIALAFFLYSLWVGR
jgi:hypothetical protein